MFRKDSSTQTIFCLHDLRDITDSDRDYAKTFQGRCYKTFLFIKETTDGKIHFCRLYYLLEFAEAPNFQTFSRRDRRKQKIARHPPTDIPACSISTEPASICSAWLCVTACVSVLHKPWRKRTLSFQIVAQRKCEAIPFAGYDFYFNAVIYQK